MSMTIILQHLRNSIDARFLVPAASGSAVVLTEDQQDATCREVIINTNDVSIKPIVVNLDKREGTEAIDVHPLLSKEAGLKQGCDYLLICPTEKAIFLLLVELKSQNFSGWLNQCVAGECLTRYVFSTIDRVKEMKLSLPLEFRHVLFTSNTGITRKRLTGNAGVLYVHEPNKQVQYTIRSCNGGPTGHNLKLLLR